MQLAPGSQHSNRTDNLINCGKHKPFCTEFFFHVTDAMGGERKRTVGGDWGVQVCRLCRTTGRAGDAPMHLFAGAYTPSSTRDRPTTETSRQLITGACARTTAVGAGTLQVYLSAARMRVVVAAGASREPITAAAAARTADASIASAPTPPTPRCCASVGAMPCGARARMHARTLLTGGRVAKTRQWYGRSSA